MTYSATDKLNNTLIMEQFEQLQTRGLAPQLAVYRQNRLVIYSRKSTGFCDRIAQLFKVHVYHRFLLAKGILSLDDRQIQPLRDNVNQLNTDLSQKERELQRLATEINTRYATIGTLGTQRAELTDAIAADTAVLTECRANIERDTAILTECRAAIEKDKAAIAEFQTARTNIERLQIEIARLERRVAELKKQEQLLVPKEQEMQVLQTMIAGFETQKLEAETALQKVNTDLKGKRKTLTEWRATERKIAGLQQQLIELEMTAKDLGTKAALVTSKTREIADLNETLKLLNQQIASLRSGKEQLQYKPRFEELQALSATQQMQLHEYEQTIAQQQRDIADLQGMLTASTTY